MEVNIFYSHVSVSVKDTKEGIRIGKNVYTKAFPTTAVVPCLELNLPMLSFVLNSTYIKTLDKNLLSFILRVYNAKEIPILPSNVLKGVTWLVSTMNIH